jgi:glycosyltransferase involved in cell wall biosynthesis
MKKIKLFVDGHWFDDLYQSPCGFLKGLYGELLNDDRFELYIAAVDLKQVRSEFNDSERIRYIPYKYHSKYYRLSIDIPSIISRYKIDMAHYQYVSPIVKTCKEIVTIHDVLFKDFPDQFPWTYRFSKDFLFKRSARRSDLITTVSGYSAEAIIRHYNVSPRKVKIIPYGISTDIIKQRELGELPDIKSIYKLGGYLLCVSRVEPRKNHVTLVRAFVELGLWKRNFKLVLIGRTDIRVAELENYIDELPDDIRKNILRLRNISFLELLGFYKEASLFVYPSLAEGFGVPPLEASVLETKILCSNATAMADFTFFEDDLFDALNIGELKSKILFKLDQDDKPRQEMISQRIRSSYNWQHIASQFADELYALND